MLEVFSSILCEPNYVSCKSKTIQLFLLWWFWLYVFSGWLCWLRAPGKCGWTILQAAFLDLFPVTKKKLSIFDIKWDISYVFYVVYSRLLKSISCDCILRSWGILFFLLCFFCIYQKEPELFAFNLLTFYVLNTINWFFFLFVQPWMTSVVLLGQNVLFFLLLAIFGLQIFQDDSLQRKLIFDFLPLSLSNWQQTNAGLMIWNEKWSLFFDGICVPYLLLLCLEDFTSKNCLKIF